MRRWVKVRLVSQHGSAHAHCAGGDQECVWVCSYRSSTPRSWHRPPHPAWLLSMAPLRAISSSVLPFRKEYVCVCATCTFSVLIYAPEWNQYLFWHVFVDRLQLCHHVTFRSSCFLFSKSSSSGPQPLQRWWMILSRRDEASRANVCYTAGK